LRRVARSPQRDARAMVENPADGEMDDAPAIALPSEIVEIPYRREVLGIARLPELRIRQTQVIAVEPRLGSHLAGQEPAAECAVGQCRERRPAAIGQQPGLDVALE